MGDPVFHVIAFNIRNDLRSPGFLPRGLHEYLPAFGHLKYFLQDILRYSNRIEVEGIFVTLCEPYDDRFVAAKATDCNAIHVRSAR